VTSALSVSAALAQVGEFSFILAALGNSLGVLPKDAQSLIVAGALLSISLNPWVLRAAAALARGTRFRYFFNFLPAHETN
jgi:CPA2 family monovalent cation:H+ antiporter-2